MKSFLCVSCGWLWSARMIWTLDASPASRPFLFHLEWTIFSCMDEMNRWIEAKGKRNDELSFIPRRLSALQ